MARQLINNQLMNYHLENNQLINHQLINNQLINNRIKNRKLMNYRYIKNLILICSLFFSHQAVKATSIDWNGQYRFEWAEVDSTDLTGSGRKSYFLHRLNLRPQIVVLDGLRVLGSFELLSNGYYPNDQMGAWFGEPLSDGPSNVSQTTRQAQQVFVRELYLRWEQEHGELWVGRSSFDFGLGLSYSRGLGLFDHFSDQWDLVAYKIYSGNLSIQPMISKPIDLDPAQGSSATDQILNILYDNQDSQSQFGVMYRKREASPTANNAYRFFDSQVNSAYTQSQASTDFKATYTNIFFARVWPEFAFQIEGGFTSGDTGLVTQTQEKIELSGYGLAIEMDFFSKDKASDWTYSLLTGVASGDDPNTARFEGYSFHKNYNPGFLLMNHPLGQFDILTSAAYRGRSANGGGLLPTSSSLDEEAVSNVMYIAPQANQKINDQWTWTNQFVYATLQSQSSRTPSNMMSKDLGFEWDTGFTFKPHDRFEWVTEVGILSPGEAFKEGTLNHKTGVTFGFQTKAAISF